MIVDPRFIRSCSDQTDGLCKDKPKTLRRLFANEKRITSWYSLSMSSYRLAFFWKVNRNLLFPRKALPGPVAEKPKDTNRNPSCQACQQRREIIQSSKFGSGSITQSEEVFMH